MAGLVWFRNDLRVQDHQLLQVARKAHQFLVPVYCFDPRHFGQTAFGFLKTGAWRAQFLQESVLNLRQSLRSLGSDLVIRIGYPEQILPQLVQSWGCDALYYHQEVTTEEVAVERSLQQALQREGVACHGFWGATLHDVTALPFAIADIPDLFTQFRKRVEASSEMAPPLTAPRLLPPLPDLPNLAVGDCPELFHWGLEAPEPDPRGQMTFTGGETAGLARLNSYIWERDRLRLYKETRNGMLHPDDSTKLSPWLALGCLSARTVQAEIERYEEERLQNDSTYWLTFELLWRDYFRWICAKYGDRVFYPSGLQGLRLPWKLDWERFNRWQGGTTGYPLVDANMRELAATGYMSNRGRQNVASFLTKNLGIDWRLGAEWFESQLIDYDVCSNWGNWNYTAGVGNDARGFRFFNILKQSKDYDPKGRYLKHWLPELAQVPVEKIHAPWQMTSAQQRQSGVTLGVHYPHPVVDLWQSAQHNEAQYNAAIAH